MLNPYILIAAIAIVAVALLYAAKFFWILGFPLADKAEVWGQFGDYMGGSLNPILNFITIILLIKSLNLQNQTNSDLREEVRENRKTEKLRSFDGLFFNMIASQKSLLDSFTIDCDLPAQALKPGANSIIHLENEVERMRDGGSTDSEIGSFLDTSDLDDRIYGILRAFYITVRMISEKLNNEEGFSNDDRKQHLLTLINFTDFAQLRLILMAIQFMDYPITKYLRDNSDFNAVLDDVGLRLDPY